MRELYEAGKLSELQSQFYQPTRPKEELYDVENDPFEINNLAANSDYQGKLKEMRTALYSWMKETNDPGLIPEPILEDLGKKYGNKFKAMKQPELSNINQRLIEVIEAGENDNISFLEEKLDSECPSERYWAATWLGVNKVKSVQNKIENLTRDENATVRVAANLALYKINPDYNPIPALAEEGSNENLIVGMYAINAIEQTGIRNDEVKTVAEKAAKSEYEFTQRFGNYLVEVCSN